MGESVFTVIVSAKLPDYVMDTDGELSKFVLSRAYATTLVIGQSELRELSKVIWLLINSE
jgi:hypothetical protein